MSAPPISDARLIEILKARQSCNSTEEATYKLGLKAPTIRYHIREAARRGLTVDSIAGEPTDPIELRRLRDRVSLEAAARKAAEKHAAYDKTIREAVFGLSAEPLSPPHWNPPASSNIEKIGEAVILMVSDLHFGELIDIHQMGGVNSYNEKIARARIQRLFQNAIKLLTTHWSGHPPSVIYILLMGDLVSGEIHDELSKTNDLLSIPAVRGVSESIIAGLDMLLLEFPAIPFRVVSIPGNHGRLTRKPESKRFAIDSYDTLVAWVIESWFSARKEQRIGFSAPASGDALIKIFGWNFLITHGDRIGSRGGTGFVGPAATISRGFQKVVMDYASQGVVIDVILIGHFHTAMELSQGFSNGCLPGPSEFSKSGRMRPEPASQWLLSVNQKRGVTRRWKILVGEPNEGNIYRGRP